MSEPVRKVVSIWGADTHHRHELPHISYARAMFKGPTTAAQWHSGDGDKFSAPYINSEIAHLYASLDRLVRPQTGRGLLVGLLDGRYESDFGPDIIPANRAKGPSSPENILKRLVKASQEQGNDKPVDVFMLVAQRPDFIHRYAQQLPRGSVIIAIKTGLTWDESWGRHIHRNAEYSTTGWSYNPGAADVLVDYLMSGAQLSYMPQIAVSGHKAMQLQHAWELLCMRETHYTWRDDQPADVLNAMTWSEEQMAALKATEGETVARLDWLAGQRGYPEHELASVYRERGEDNWVPNSYRSYAYAVIEMSARLFGPTHSWQALDDARNGIEHESPFAPAPVPAGYRLAAGIPNTPSAMGTGVLESRTVAARATRLTATEMASLPPKLQKIAQVAPAAIRRILRR